VFCEAALRRSDFAQDVGGNVIASGAADGFPAAQRGNLLSSKRIAEDCRVKTGKIIPFSLAMT